MRDTLLTVRGHELSRVTFDSHRVFTLHRLIRKICVVLVVPLGIVTANEGLRGGSHGSNRIEELVQQVLEAVETQALTIDTLSERIAQQDLIIQMQGERISELQAMFEHDGPFMSRRLNSTMYDSEDCLPVYNETLGYCVFELPVSFMDESVFNGGVTFENDVFFEENVSFNDDATFFDDVTVEGPESSAADPSEFIVKGNVEVTFEEDSMLLVDTESLFRGDVKVALDEDDVGRRRALNDYNNDNIVLKRGHHHRHLGHKTYRSKFKDQPTLFAYNLEVENDADLNKLSAAVVDVDELTATDAEINTLNAEEADVDDLTATDADVQTLKVSESAQFGTSTAPITVKVVGGIDVQKGETGSGVVKATAFTVSTDTGENVLSSSGLVLTAGSVNTNGGAISTGGGLIDAGDGTIKTGGAVEANSVTATLDVVSTDGNVRAPNGCIEDANGVLGAPCPV